MHRRTPPLAAALVLAVVLGTASEADADLLPLPTPILPGLPTLPVPLPLPTGRPTPTPTTQRPTTSAPRTGAATTTQPLPGATVSGDKPPATASTEPAVDSGDDLYPEPPVDPVTTPQARLVARLDEVEHQLQYLHNALTRMHSDLAAATSGLNPVDALITGFIAPGTPSAPSGAVDRPPDRVLALTAAIASAEDELTRGEALAQALQRQIDTAVTAPATTTPGGRLAWPIRGEITSRFGNRLDPYYHVWQLHAGIDIAAPMGATITAAAPGRVVQAGWNGGYGNYTCIEHGQAQGQRLTTCYGHQSAFLVRPGDEVVAGQPIGRVGSTGASTGPHVHFEVRLGGRPVDPLPWL